MKLPLVKLDSNENPYGPSPRAILAALNSLKGISRYPQSIRILEERIASSLGIEADWVISSSGGDRIIELVLRSLAKNADRLVIPIPGFQMYTYLSNTLGIKVNFLQLPIGDHAGLIEEVRRGDLVIIGSPNNPDGKILDKNTIETLLQNCAWLVLDEAYAEYARTSFAPLTIDYSNLIVIKTFSKAFALAGLRVGYLVASGVAANSIRSLVGPYEISSIGAEACMAALDDLQYYDRIIDLTCKNRSKLFEELKEIACITVFPSNANFLLFQLLKSNATEVWKALKQRNVLIRNCTGWKGLDGEFMRVTVGTGLELARFISSLKEVLES